MWRARASRDSGSPCNPPLLYAFPRIDGEPGVILQHAENVFLRHQMEIVCGGRELPVIQARHVILPCFMPSHGLTVSRASSFNTLKMYFSVIKWKLYVAGASFP